MLRPASIEIEDFTSIGPDVGRPLHRHLVRVVRCRRGRVEVTSKLLIPPDYPRCELTVERRGRDTDGAEDERVRAIMLR